MSDDEIYNRLKSGEAPRFIKGIEDFDDSELVQWLVSYHEDTKAELIGVLQAMLNKAYKQNWNDQYPDEVDAARAAIARALGQ